jgi:adenylate kinase
MRLLIIGPPGGGKGSNASILEEILGIKHIPTGDILRAEIASGSDLGKEIASYIDDGNFIPNDLCIRMVHAQLPDDNYLLDGFPRTLTQAESLKDIKLDAVINIDIPDELVKERLIYRRMNKETGEIYHLKHNPPPEGVELTQRKDDREEVVATRLKRHHADVAPIIEHYRSLGLVIDIDGSQELNKVTNDITKALRRKQGRFINF